MIEVGQQLPAYRFQTFVRESVITENVDQLFSGINCLILGVSGAFFEFCAQEHITPFDTQFTQFKSLGIDKIYVVSVNDAQVLSAWHASQGWEHIQLLADGDGAFVKALGLLESTPLLGERSQRFAILSQNAQVQALFYEASHECEATSAENLLYHLNQLKN